MSMDAHSSSIPSNSLSDIYPSPPSYEEAIQQSLQALDRDATSPREQPEPSGLAPGDYADAVAALQDFDERDLEDERDYEESRPLKMGRIPDARAQYTFIQPSDTANRTGILSYPPPTCSVHSCETLYASTPSCASPVLHAPSAPVAPTTLEPSHLHQRRSLHKQDRQDDDISNDHNATRQSQPVGASSSSSMSHSVTPSQPQPPQFAGIPPIPGNLMNVQDISIADYKRTKKGAESYDSILEDPYQLYRFFVAHNDRPMMHLLVRGYHTEKKESQETDSDGNSKLVSKDIQVEDFKIDFDLTPYISPRGALYTTPDAKTGKTLTLREVMEQFAEEDNLFKEMHMHKAVMWDYEELTRAITHAIRSVHYRYTIDISFPCTNNVVIVKSSSPAANFMRNPLTKALCFISVIGFVMYPARGLYKKVKDKTLKSEFQMMISTRDFYMQNYWTIVNQVQYR